MRLGDRDPAVRQFERDAVVACLGMALAALAVRGGRLDGAIGVLLGGLLASVTWCLEYLLLESNYWKIREAGTRE